MSLSNNKSGVKIEYIVIAILTLALSAMVVYFVMNNMTSTTPPAQVAAPSAQVAAPTTTEPTVDVGQSAGYAMAVGQYNGDIHPIVGILDKLKGFKYDDSVAPADTVYIVYDPRCPYCEALLNKVNALDLKQKQITIKWLPSLALGVTDEAEKQAALSLRAKSIEDFSASFQADVDVSGVTITQDDKDAMNENMAFLFEASEQTFGKEYPKSVPAVFFIDKKTGTPNMMYGASDDAVFKQIFGE